MFKKQSYSDLEIQEIMQALFLEKKKVKELQLKLSNCSLSPVITPSSEELSSLKTEIKTLLIRLEESKFKQQQTESRTLLAENELALLKQTLQNHETTHLEITEAKQKEAQLERVIQFMRARLEETQFENHQLLQKFTDIEEKEKKFQEDLFNAKHEHQKLSESLQREKQEKEELQQEENALKIQMEHLRSEISKMQSAYQIAISDEKQQQEAFSNSQKEIDLLKQMMMKTLHEFKEEKQKEELSYQSQITTLKQDLEKEKKISEEVSLELLEKKNLFIEHQTKIEQVNKESIELAEELDKQKRAYLELAQFSEEIKSKFVKSEDNLLKKEELINNLSSQVANLSRAHEKIEGALRQGTIDHQEHEIKLRTAQQHLAKKMRESATLADAQEELKQRFEAQEKLLESSKTKLVELKAQVEAESHQKQSIQQQYQEGIKSFEAQSARWEQKYFQMHEKWQETETQNRELKRLEERFCKLQSVFGQLGNIIGAPHEVGSPPHPAQSAHPGPAPKKFSEVELIPKGAMHGPEPTLFETTPPESRRYKESLFG